MAAIGAALAGTTVALIAFSGRLAKIARRIRPVLDVALDVDNHLRERPLGNNPRAKSPRATCHCSGTSAGGAAGTVKLTMRRHRRAQPGHRDHSGPVAVHPDLERPGGTRQEPMDPRLARIDAHAGGKQAADLSAHRGMSASTTLQPAVSGSLRLGEALRRRAPESAEVIFRRIKSSRMASIPAS